MREYGSYHDESRVRWQSTNRTAPPSTEQLTLGCLQRIADAIEKLAGIQKPAPHSTAERKPVVRESAGAEIQARQFWGGLAAEVSTAITQRIPPLLTAARKRLRKGFRYLFLNEFMRQYGYKYDSLPEKGDDARARAVLWAAEIDLSGFDWESLHGVGPGTARMAKEAFEAKAVEAPEVGADDA